MPKTLLTVGTRKGAFLLESDDRRDWTVRGPYCEGWPVYHAVYDADTGAIYAAAASEWHGSAIWRSSDLGETWEQSSEGLTYGDDDGRKISKVSTLARGARPAARRRRGAGHLREPRRRRDVVAPLDPRRASPAARTGTTRRTSRRGTSASRTSSPTRRLRQLLRGRAGRRRVRDDGRRHDVDAAQPRAARATGPPSTRRSASASTSSCARRRPAAHVPAEPRRHAPLRRRRPVVDGDHRGAAGASSASPRRPTRTTARRST